MSEDAKWAVFSALTELTASRKPLSDGTESIALPNRTISWLARRQSLMLGQAIQRVCGAYISHGAWWRLVAVVALVIWGFLLPENMGAQAKPHRRILILNEVDPSYPLINLADQGIRTALDNSPYQIEFDREYMETVQFPDQADQDRIRDFYIRKYQNHKPDVIITVGSSPLKLMADAHGKSFPGIPVVFCFPNAPTAAHLTLDPDFVGVEGDIAPAATVAAALRLLPDTLHLAVVGGVAPYDRRQEDVVKEQLRVYGSHLDIAYLTDLTTPSLLDRLRHLPPHSIVLLTALGKDTAGTTYTSNESGPMVVSNSNAPVFSYSDRLLNQGEVGGDISSAVEQGKLAGGIVLRLLNGKRPQDIPSVKESAIYTFDWRALKRWGLKEKNLPPGSIVLNRPPDFWIAYGPYILGGILLLLVQSVAIFALLWQTSRRKKSESRLRESEGRFRLVANTAPVMIWMCNSDKLCTYLNQTWLDFTGRSLEEELGNGWMERVHPEDLVKLLDAFAADFNRRGAFTMEYRHRRRDGEYRWIFDYGVPRFNEDGSFEGYIGSSADVTERKAAEEALSSVNRRMVEAQDAERARIARELHDDINQRMALIAVNLQSVLLDDRAPDLQMRHAMEEASMNISKLGIDIQTLSRSLHPSNVEYLGLESASAGLCREVANRHNIEIGYHVDHISRELPSEVALCLFRVLQEALQNAVKHSGTRRIDVSLTDESSHLELRVRDFGKGLDPHNPNSSHGLGLTSMKERLRLVGGALAIDSKPQHGTTVIAQVPVGSTIVSAEAEVTA